MRRVPNQPETEKLTGANITSAFLRSGWPTDKKIRKLQELLDAGRVMHHSILVRDRRPSLETLVSQAYTLLEAESCAIFLRPDDTPTELVLDASYSELRGTACQRVRVSMQTRNRAGI